MELKFLDKPSKDAILIIPVFKKEKPDPALSKFLAKLKKTKDFSAREGQVFFSIGRIKIDWPSRILLAGCGKSTKINYEKILEIFADAVKFLASRHPQKISILFNESFSSFPQALTEAVSLSNYQPAKSYKTSKSLNKLKEQSIQTLELIGVPQNKEIRANLEKGLLMGEQVNEVRDWVNAPPNFANIKFFEEKAREIAKKTKSRLTILTKRNLEKLGMGGLLAVNRGGREEARMLILDYCPKGVGRNAPPAVFVGKGIIFDSGGYNLKPAGHIEDMQSDKAGAAALFGVISLLPKLDIKTRVVVVTPLTDNLIGPDALKPSEIIKTYSGRTVEITNTDAEGRLILCDAISYAVDKFKPKFLIDIATLTGACVVALGDRFSGLFGNDKDLVAKIKKAGGEVDELFWQLPLHKSFSEKMKGYYADLRNSDTGSSRYAGASKGAAFLKEFVGKTPWAHLDIAGPAFTSNPKKYECKGATGAGVRSLARFLEKLES